MAAATLCVFLFAAIGCGPGSSPPPADARPLVVALLGDVDSWNPYVSNEATSWDVLSLLYPRLVRETGRPDGPRFEPWLAESWEFSPDRKTLTFRLRDAHWSDGTPVTCDDVTFTYGIQTAAALSWPGSYLKERIDGVDCPDAQTAVFRFSEAYPNQLLDANDDAIVPRAYGDVPLDAWVATTWQDRAVTCGPFRLVSVTPGQEAVLERDPQWWGADGVGPGRVVFRVYGTAQGAVAALVDGSIDLLPRVPPLGADDLGAAPGVEVLEVPSLSYTYLGWNVLAPDAYVEDRRRRGCGGDDECVETEADILRLQTQRPHPILGSAEIRRALALAIDRQDIVDGVWNGHARVGDTPVVSGLPEYDSGGALPFDRPRAQQMLDQAGLRDSDGDGWRDRGGRPVELDVIVNSDNQVRRDTLERVRASLAGVGIRVRPEPLARAEFVARARDKAFDAVVSGWRAGSRIEPENFLHTRAAVDRGNNLMSWSTPESDALMTRAAAAISEDEATLLWIEWQRLFRQEQPITILYEETQLIGVNRRLHDLNPTFLNPFHNLHRSRLANTAGE